MTKSVRILFKRLFGISKMCPPKRQLPNLRAAAAGLRGPPRAQAQTGGIAPTFAQPVLKQEEVRLNAREVEEIRNRVRGAESELPELVIDDTLLYLYDDDELRNIATVQVTEDKTEGEGSVNDAKMGVTDHGKACGYERCRKDVIDCPGHLGYIELKRPMYHPVYLRTIVYVLNCVCNSCGRVRLSRTQLEAKGILALRGIKRLRAIENSIDASVTCISDLPEGEEGQGAIQPCSLNPEFVTTSLKETNKIEYRMIDPVSRKKGPNTVMSIEDVRKILDSISDADAELLGFENGSHPRKMIIQTIPVIPPVARPSMTQDGRVWTDYITNLYVSILRENKKINDRMDNLEVTSIVDTIYRLYRNIIEGPDGAHEEGQGIKDRIQGKEAIIRKALMGGRVNYSGRTVLGPDPTLKFGQIRVPRYYASKLTVPEVVNQYNFSKIEKLLREGKITMVVEKSSGRSIQINEKNKETFEIHIGDKAQRHLQDGDTLMFGRQPTLHRQSLMGGKVVLADELTLGLPLFYTTPMNADFDGDEGTLHSLQTIEARAEAGTIASVFDCLMNAQSNKPSMGIVYDVLTGLFLMTQPNVMIDKMLWMDLLMEITPDASISNLPLRLAKYNVPMYSGKAMFSCLLPETLYYKKGKVEIIEGVLVSGEISKAHVGVEHNSIIQHLYTNYGPERTGQFLSDASFVVNRWLAENPFTVGMADCVPLQSNVDEIIEAEIAKSQIKVRALGTAPLEALEAEQHEKQIKGIVNSVKAVGDTIATKALDIKNSLVVTSEAGSKGTRQNIAQIMGMLSQQFISGERPKPTLSDGSRCLPYFDFAEDSIEGRGFCRNSFLKGLNPAEMFFHLEASRIGITDSAIKTADSGSLAHKLSKALEDTQVKQDGSVRNARDVITDFTYAGDSFDVAKLHFTEGPQTGEGVASFISLPMSTKKYNSLYGF